MADYTHGANSFDGEHSNKNTKNLRNYLQTLSLHPDVKKHHSIAKSFGVSNYRPIFRQDAIGRFLDAISKEPTTAATVSKLTGITHKYLCQLKWQLQKQRRLEVAYFDRCPTTNSRNVQFLKSV